MVKTIFQCLGQFLLATASLNYYLGIANEEEGAEVTLTFDKALKESRYFKVLAN
jgi:hypothetical protein